MTFETVLAKLRLTAGPSGHSFQFPGSPYSPESPPDVPLRYLNDAYILYENPVLRSELEESLKLLTEGAVEAGDMVTKEACKLSMKALLAFYDSLKLLHDRCMEEREKREEAKTNPKKGREEDIEIPGFPTETNPE